MPSSVLVVVTFDGRREWERELSLGLTRVKEVESSPGLFSRRAVDVIKWTEDCVERIGDGGVALNSSLSAEVSTERLPGLRTPGLRVGSLGFLESLGVRGHLPSGYIVSLL